MIGKIVGALVGRELDRRAPTAREGSRSGQARSGGLKGAALGAVAAGALRRLGPFGLVLGGAYVAKKALDRRREARRAG